MYDLVIIGGGPAGYKAALKAVSLKKRVVLIEKDKLGGVCLNSGCIPTKTLLHSAKLFKKCINASEIGVNVSDITFSQKNAVLHKDQVVKNLRESLESHLIRSGIEIVYGEGCITSPNCVTVNNRELETEYILISTGSKNRIPDIKGINSDYVYDSSSILDLKETPNKLVIIGGGVIGLEFASYYSSIGTEVTVIEACDSILPNIDERLVKILISQLKIKLILQGVVNKIEDKKVTFQVNNIETALETDAVLISAGRVPVERMEVNEYLMSATRNIYLAGDVTGQTNLAHVSEYMGELAVNNMFLQQEKVNLQNIPSIIYSDPEIATVGLTLKDAKKQIKEIIKSTYYLKNNGRYQAESGDEKGICIIVADKETRVLQGVHLVGSGVSEIISIGALAIKKRMTIEDFKDVILPHPTISESIKESILFL